MKHYLVQLILSVSDAPNAQFEPKNLSDHLALPEHVAVRVIDTVECANDTVHVVTVQADDKNLVRICQEHGSGIPTRYEHGMSMGRYSISQEQYV